MSDFTGMAKRDYTITDEEIDEAWFGSWGDNPSKREIIAESLLKIAGGYVTGYTALCILRELGLLGKKNLTKRGRRVMFEMNYKRTSPARNDKDVQEALEWFNREVESKEKHLRSGGGSKRSDHNDLMKQLVYIKIVRSSLAMQSEYGNIVDWCDLMVDEFLRIKGIINCAPVSVWSKEIEGICNRAIKNTKQHVPVIKQRDVAQSILTRTRLDLDKEIRARRELQEELSTTKQAEGE